MKYRQLIKQLENFPKSMLDDDATVYIESLQEFYKVDRHLEVTEEDDILPANHIYIVIENV